MTTRTPPNSLRDWPTLATYTDSALDQVVLPVGGIGTGTIGFAGNGSIADVEIANRPAKGWRPTTAFIAMRVEHSDGRVNARALEGPIPRHRVTGEVGSDYPTQGLPRFRSATLDAAYPFARAQLTDESMPPTTIGCFNPLIPGDVEASAWPLAHYRVGVHNPDKEPIVVSTAFSMENFIGMIGVPVSLISVSHDGAGVGRNRNDCRRAGGAAGVLMSAPGLVPNAEQAGSIAIAALDADDVSIRTSWGENNWNTALLDFWDDFVDDGAVDERESVAAYPIASIAHTKTIAPGAYEEFDFVVAWNFPNRRAWSSEQHLLSYAEYSEDIVGNAYSVAHPDPWTTIEQYAVLRNELEARSLAAVRAIVDSSVPRAITEAALFNLSTLRTQTLFRTADGALFGWEGVMGSQGSCFGNCSHVWGYEFATSHLFSTVAQSFRETQYLHATDDAGFMAFRVGLPLNDRAMNWRLAAADGQMAALVHLYVDWKLSADEAFLAKLWDRARRSLEFAWIPGGWDEDQDGVMEGCQHNTMDVEYYGPNPQMGTWYLAALRAMAIMARHRNEDDFADRCEGLFRSGSRILDGELFTGEYYRHDVRPTPEGGIVADGLRHWDLGSSNLIRPDYQLGDGVLVDQLVGQYAARVAGLGSLLDPAHVTTTLQTIRDRNFRDGLHGHFNHMRGFAVESDAALLMCTYRKGERPARPFPYFTEAMTGFEYTAAAGMIQEGLREAGLDVIEAIRARFDGTRRNPFDEPECGHHYARALASWSAFLAWNGIDYDARSATLTVELDSLEGSTFWSTGSAWGVWSQRHVDGGLEVTVDVMEGSCALSFLRNSAGESALRELTGDPRRTAGYRAEARFGL